MITIRFNAFETNSSSAHAIVIPNKLKNIKSQANCSDKFCSDKLHVNDNGYVVIHPIQLNWEKDSYYSTESKAMALAAAAYELEYREQDKKYTKQLTRVIKQITNCKDVIYTWDIPQNTKLQKLFGQNSKTPSIDHESIYLYESLFDSDELLINFIFNDECCFFTNNDNNDDIQEELQEIKNDYPASKYKVLI